MSSSPWILRRIVAIGNTRLRTGALTDFTDPSTIYGVLDRVSRAGHEDPALAIGSAKELIGSTAKIVLRERGLPLNDRDDVAQLVCRTTSVAPASELSNTRTDGSDAVKKILGGV